VRAAGVGRQLHKRCVRPRLLRGDSARSTSFCRCRRRRRRRHGSRHYRSSSLTSRKRSRRNCRCVGRYPLAAATGCASRRSSVIAGCDSVAAAGDSAAALAVTAASAATARSAFASAVVPLSADDPVAAAAGSATLVFVAAFAADRWRSEENVRPGANYIEGALFLINST